MADRDGRSEEGRPDHRARSGTSSPTELTKKYEKGASIRSLAELDRTARTGSCTGCSRESGVTLRGRGGATRAKKKCRQRPSRFGAILLSRADSRRLRSAGTGERSRRGPVARGRALESGSRSRPLSRPRCSTRRPRRPGRPCALIGEALRATHVAGGRRAWARADRSRPGWTGGLFAAAEFDGRAAASRGWRSWPPSRPDATIAGYQAGFALATRACPASTVAAVQGHAVGAGSSSRWPCDLRVVAEDVQLLHGRGDARHRARPRRHLPAGAGRWATRRAVEMCLTGPPRWARPRPWRCGLAHAAVAGRPSSTRPSTTSPPPLARPRRGASRRDPGAARRRSRDGLGPAEALRRRAGRPAAPAAGPRRRHR